MSISMEQDNNTKEDVAKVNAAVMNVNAELFTGGAVGDEERISKINLFMEATGPTIYNNHGRFIHVTESGVLAIFEESCESAVECAVTICQTLLSGGEDKICDGLAIGINFGVVCTGAASYSGFTMPLVLSDCIDVAEHLSTSAHKYNSRILITDSVAKRISNFNGRYSNRRLGQFCRASRNEPEFIYDIYDGDSTDIKYSKRRGKLFFETGVDLFLQKNYLQARSYFIELLKFDRNDRAAKQYVYICDACISGDPDESGDLNKKYIEVW